MDLNHRIEPFIFLGNFLKDFPDKKNSQDDPLSKDLETAIQQAKLMNQWFTWESIEAVLRYWSLNLSKEVLEEWLEPYTHLFRKEVKSRDIAVIMAGNIPLVGFHDFMTVLISGNRFIGRLSSDDTELLPAIARVLISYDAGLHDSITFTKERLSNFDAVIATGSNSSSNYFNYYFSKVPHIIRKNRNGIAILTGDENEVELSGLSDDIFLYFGLGCRNVSKLYLPDNYDFEPLFKAFLKYRNYSTHHKWMNNYDYYRSVFLLNQIPTLDNGFVLLNENRAISSPPAVLYYEFYNSIPELSKQLSTQSDEIQVIVCKEKLSGYSCIPGQAQFPGLSDYADGIDTMKFLLESEIVKRDA